MPPMKPLHEMTFDDFPDLGKLKRLTLHDLMGASLRKCITKALRELYTDNRYGAALWDKAKLHKLDGVQKEVLKVLEFFYKKKAYQSASSSLTELMRTKGYLLECRYQRQTNGFTVGFSLWVRIVVVDGWWVVQK